MTSKKICPINKTICEEERCMWWVEVNTKHGECAIKILARRFIK